jgi:hypothetical protein
MTEDVLKILQQFGFPVFVAVWLLIRTDNYVREMTVAVRELTEMIRSGKKG